MIKQTKICITLATLLCATTPSLIANEVQVNTKDYVNLRVAPGTKSKVIKVLGPNTPLTIKNSDNGWCQVGTGYIDCNYLVAVSSVSASINSPDNTTIKEAVVATNVLNLRASNSVDSPIVGKAFGGQTVNIIELVGDWYLLDNGKYAKAEFIKILEIEQPIKQEIKYNDTQEVISRDKVLVNMPQSGSNSSIEEKDTREKQSPKSTEDSMLLSHKSIATQSRDIDHNTSAIKYDPIIESAIVKLIDNNQQITNEFNKTNEKLSDINKVIESLISENNKLKKQIKDIEIKTNGSNYDLKKMNDLEGKLDEVINKTNKSNIQFSNALKDIETLSKEIADLKAKLANNPNMSMENLEQINKISQNIQKHEKAIMYIIEDLQKITKH